MSTSREQRHTEIGGGPRERKAKRAATAKADGTLVLAIGAAPAGEAYAPAGWDTQYLEGDS